MRYDQRWLVQLLDHIRHGKCLTGACHSQKRLRLISLPEALHKLCDRLRLVSGWLIWGMQFKCIHPSTSICDLKENLPIRPKFV